MADLMAVHPAICRLLVVQPSSSMSRLSLRVLGATLLTLLLPLAGCDETGDLTSGSIEQRVNNAVAARQSGNFDLAVRILEAAYAESPDSKPVRTEYAVTLLERKGINLLDLDRLAGFLTSSVTATPAAPTNVPALRGGCAYANDPSATLFDPRSYAGSTELEADRDVILQTLALLDPVIPDALQNFSVCTGITSGPDGAVLNYDPAAALAEMRAAGLTDEQIGLALSSNALARFMNAYLFLTLDVPQQTQWYRINGGSGVGLCADDPEALLDQAEEAVADLGEAAFSMDLRAATFGSSSTTQQLVDLVTEGYTEIRDGIGDYCSN